MALTKTKLQSKLNSIIQERQAYLDKAVAEGRLNKTQARRLRADMLMRLENALSNAQDDIFSSIQKSF